jgi:hypothetical protein
LMALHGRQSTAIFQVPSRPWRYSR